ncbi:hypothetical protein GCM10010954_12950 [Halobacillus andaensis]|uniref:DUF418 domain-containing protein n=1 Tax=Halobacillus andaensis TaxID=1176239 RepID=A0A917B1W4_HALAA|nr:DUF418 domain-containing protein [Halobacillus andaensis]MBP2004091.1 uncharacterized protein [Halobacillus andaensis]GGF15719.1 hypothetical protein GCM10010954_12950 [Halobacillus andaensis]
MKQQGAPLQDRDRLSWIDAARGLAILGIFMVNVPAFNAPYFLYGGEDQFFPSETSQAVQTIIDIFFQASFYTLFSLMFGFGLYMMKERLEQKHVSYRPIIFRRLMVLLGFGAVHAFLIWHGDILLSYGLFGFAMFAFFNASPKTLIITAFTMLGVLTFPLTLGLYAVRSKLGAFSSYAEVEAAKQNYGEGSLLNIWQQNFADWTYSNNLATLPLLALSLIPMFLLGAYIAKKKWLHHPEDHLATIKRWWVMTGVLFILFKAGPYVIGNPEWFQLMQDNIGGSSSAVFYLLTVTLAFRSSVGKKLVKPLTWVGRMSLSNYIFQSVICFILFYSVGFGWYGEVTPLASVGIVVIIFSFQVVLSKLWINKYQYGPLEWLWRTMTYGKKQPLKRSDSQAS